MRQPRNEVDMMSNEQLKEKQLTFYDNLRIMVSPVSSWLSFEATYTLLVFAALYVFIGFLSLYQYSLPVKNPVPNGLDAQAITFGATMPIVIFVGIVFAVLSFRGKYLATFYNYETPESLVTLRLFSVTAFLLLAGVVTCTVVLYAMPSLSLNDKQYVSLVNGGCASLFAFLFCLFCYWTAKIRQDGMVEPTTFPPINKIGEPMAYIVGFAFLGTVIYGATYSLNFAL